MKKLLQEIRDFEKYKNCLSKELYEVYKRYLVERILNEIAPEGLAHTFRRFLSQNEKDSSEATVIAVNKLKKATLTTQYSRLYNKIVKDGHTNLETSEGEFCDKETFIREFEKLNFDEFKDKVDLVLDDTVKTFLNRYLEMYDDDGWLILPDYDKVVK